MTAKVLCLGSPWGTALPVWTKRSSSRLWRVPTKLLHSSASSWRYLDIVRCHVGYSAGEVLSAAVVRGYSWHFTEPSTVSHQLVDDAERIEPVPTTREVHLQRPEATTLLDRSTSASTLQQRLLNGRPVSICLAR